MMSQIAVRTNGELNWILTDHLSSASVIANADGTFLSEVKYTAYGEIRSGSGDMPTDYQYTGQLSQMDEIGLLYFTARWYDPVLGRWAQPDIIVPVASQGIQAFDRYAFVNNCPLRYTDPTGHALKDDNSGCAICPPTPKVYPNAEKSKQDYVIARANLALSTYGGKNDLKAMVQIVKAAAIAYGSYKEMMPVLTEIFVGKPYSTYSVIYDAGNYGGGCEGMGRNPDDCDANKKSGLYFVDTGFHDDFRDGHNQLFHYWAYVATAASTDIDNPFSTLLGVSIGGFANIYHEILAPDSQATWADYMLATEGIKTGALIKAGVIPPQQIGNYLTVSLGDTGKGSYGVRPFMVSFLPLRSDRSQP